VKTYSSIPANERSQLKPCPLCNENSLVFHYEIDHAVYHRCVTCNLIQQNPQPVLEDLLDRYDGDYFDYEIANEESFYGLMLQGLDDVSFWDEADNLKKKGSFLDVGCATGRLLLRMKKEGWEPEGIEVCKSSAQFASSRGGFPVHLRPLEELNLPSNKFSVVHASHLIEHLVDPGAFCDEVFRILSPGGLFILTTPNIEGLQSRLFQSRWRSAIPDHLFLFGKRTLTKMLTNAGFEIGTVKTWGGLAKGAGPRWIKIFLDKMVKPLNWGDVMIIAVRKPIAKES